MMRLLRRNVMVGLHAAVVLAWIFGGAARAAGESTNGIPTILGLSGQLSDIRVAVRAADQVSSLAASDLPCDINLKRIAEWALHYLIETARKEFGYEPVFAADALKCPPYPHASDPTVPCDSDARMSITASLARSGHPEYFDFVERDMRNRISPVQFVSTPELEVRYREKHYAAGADKIRQGWQKVQKLQGGFLADVGFNDCEYGLTRRDDVYAQILDCCAPEGMRAIYTTWKNTILLLPKSPLGPAGVYVNMSFNPESQWEWSFPTCRFKAG